MTDEKPRRRRRKKRPTKWKGGRSRSRKNYRTEEFILTISHAEMAIYQAFVMSDYELTDSQARNAVRALVRELRDDGYTAPDARREIEIEGEESLEDLIVWLIKRSWAELFEEEPRHPDEDLIGCLGVILDSIETWSTPSPESRGYLWYSVAFLENLGFQVQVVAEEGDELEWEEEPATDEDDLRELGEDWLDDPSDANFAAFRQQALEMLNERQAQEVINVCQYLIGWTNDEATIRKLSPFLGPAYKQLGGTFRQSGPR